MSLSFRTNGNFVDFVNTDSTSLAVETTLKSLHNTSRCVEWSLPSDSTRISFRVDDLYFENVLITEIDFDGTAMDSQDDFATEIVGLFPGLSSGGEEGGASYSVYTALLTQSGTDAPTANVLENTLGGTVVWSRDNAGAYRGTLTGAFTVNKTLIPNKINWISDTDIDYLEVKRNSSGNYVSVDHYVAGEQLDDFTNVPIEIRVYP